jgi:hypothetical protein
MSSCAKRARRCASRRKMSSGPWSRPGVGRAAPAAPGELDGLWPDPGRAACPVFHLPPLSGSWAACAEGLAHPHTGEIRPIVFDHQLARGGTTLSWPI